MSRSMLKSKIHRATVTQADLDYEGSITMDVDLLEAADISPNEEVHVWNVTRGTRLTTYALCGERGSGVVCMNGAAAHLCHVDDVIIVASFVQMEDAPARAHQPRVVRVGRGNHLVGVTREECAGPGPGSGQPTTPQNTTAG